MRKKRESLQNKLFLMKKKVITSEKLTKSANQNVKSGKSNKNTWEIPADKTTPQQAKWQFPSDPENPYRKVKESNRGRNWRENNRRKPNPSPRDVGVKQISRARVIRIRSFRSLGICQQIDSFVRSFFQKIGAARFRSVRAKGASSNAQRASGRLGPEPPGAGLAPGVLYLERDLDNREKWAVSRPTAPNRPLCVY